MAIRVERRKLNQEIDEALQLRRPDRYNPDSDEETAWIAEVAKDFEADFRTPEQVKVTARDYVGRREGTASQRGIAQLRSIYRAVSGDQQSIAEAYEWLVSGGRRDMPISIVERLMNSDGDYEESRTRVAFRAANARDYRTFAVHERRNAGREFRARIDACEGAEMIADWMEKEGK